MNFSKLTECPFCGCDEFYTKEYVYGTMRCRSRFDGKEADNSDLYDGLSLKESSGRIYCDNCNKFLGNRKNNTLSKAAEKALIKKGTRRSE